MTEEPQGIIPPNNTHKRQVQTIEKFPLGKIRGGIAIDKGGGVRLKGR
jgi:hypothetical protein